jgi:hypothetical protein
MFVDVIIESNAKLQAFLSLQTIESKKRFVEVDEKAENFKFNSFCVMAELCFFATVYITEHQHFIIPQIYASQSFRLKSKVTEKHEYLCKVILKTNKKKPLGIMIYLWEGFISGIFGSSMELLRSILLQRIRKKKFPLTQNSPGVI